jgi:hypothetical protein
MSEQLSRRVEWDPSKLHFESPIPQKEARFKELVLHIAQECLDDPTYSRIKLLMILFYSDFESYGRYGAPITGMSYRKLPFGPAPAAFSRIQEEMLRDRLIRIVKRRVYDQSSHRLLPLQDPNYEILSAPDISIVDGWIRFFWNKSAKEVSEYSHGKAWKLALESELIPYEAVFISDEPVTEEDVAKVKELAKRYGWKM